MQINNIYYSKELNKYFLPTERQNHLYKGLLFDYNNVRDHMYNASDDYLHVHFDELTDLQYISITNIIENLTAEKDKLEDDLFKIKKTMWMKYSKSDARQ